MKSPGLRGQGPIVFETAIGPDFFETYGAHLLAGRWLAQSRGGDFPDPDARTGAAPTINGAPQYSVPNLVLNAKAVLALGFRNAQEAVGKLLIASQSTGPHPFRVIGVIDDIRFGPPRNPLPPTAYLPFGAALPFPQATVQYSGTDPRVMIARLREAWRRIAPTEPFEAKTADQALAPYYLGDEQNGRLFTLGALLAVGIACVGLYGSASFNTSRRVKEIGIRKTLGASTADILQLLVREFLRPVLIANLAAWPLAWWAMRAWLSGYDQRIALTPLYFVATSALLLLIAAATITGQAVLVARAEPARALRRE